jgi:cation diffusion facilitator family transporter
LSSRKSRIDPRSHQSRLAVLIGLAGNILLAVAKTTVGVLGHSQALLADGVNSTSDVAYYLVVAVFMRLAGKPPDESHPYGHNQLESISSLVVGAFVVTTGIAILWDAVNNVFDLVSGASTFKGAELITLWIALLTIGMKIGLTVYTIKVSKKTENPAVLALAYDHRNDIFTASGAAVGIFLGRAGYPWVDPAVGALVALFVLRTGFEIIRQSSADLMDAVPSRALADQITNLLGDNSQVLQVEELHAHRFGPYLVINVTIGVDGDLSVTQGDAIASKVENQIVEAIDLVRHVYVHYHPVSEPGRSSNGESETQYPNVECSLE